MKNKLTYTLSIAGFDPCGGAGVLADVQTFAFLKTQAMGVNTAITAQTEDKFHCLNWLSLEEVFEQLNPLVNRYEFPYVKIGILPNENYLNEIGTYLHKAQNNTKIIWDPVMKASAGFGIGNFNSEKINWDQIFFLTPNQKEAERLNIPKTVNHWITGGDCDTRPGWDTFIYKGKSLTLRPKSKDCFPKHGSGCILSSAFTAYLALGFPPLKAAIRAKHFVEKRLSSNKSLLASYRK